jgi:hypothetical protein
VDFDWQHDLFPRNSYCNSIGERQGTRCGGNTCRSRRALRPFDRNFYPHIQHERFQNRSHSDLA